MSLQDSGPESWPARSVLWLSLFPCVVFIVSQARWYFKSSLFVGDNCVLPLPLSSSGRAKTAFRRTVSSVSLIAGVSNHRRLVSRSSSSFHSLTWLLPVHALLLRFHVRGRPQLARLCRFPACVEANCNAVLAGSVAIRLSTPGASLAHKVVANSSLISVAATWPAGARPHTFPWHFPNRYE